jgi:hypothetical protein
MSNIINVTNCDDQLTILAVSSDKMNMYRVAQVVTGSQVNVSISLEEGTFVQPAPILQPAAAPTAVNSVVCLPADTYSIYYSGFNMGGPYNYRFTLNDSTYKLLNDPAQPMFGYIWSAGGPELSKINVVIG